MSTIYTVRGPDGQLHDFRGPDDAKPDAVLAAARAQFSQQAAPAPPPPSDNGSAFDTSGVMGGVYSAAHGLEDVATFGQGDKLAAGIGMLLNGKGYDENLARIKATAAAAQQDHPYAGYIGDAAGLVSGGGVVRDVVRAAKALPIVGRAAAAADAALTPRAGQGVRNVLKSAGTNAAIGGGVSLANGDSLPQTAENAAISGVAGPIVGKAADFAIRKMAPASQKAMLLLAKHLKMSPDDLEAAVNRQRAATGADTSIAENANLRSVSSLKDLAGNASTIGEAANTAAERTPLPLTQQNAAVTPGKMPQTLAGLRDVRKATMDAAMAPIKNSPVPITAGDIDLLMDRDAYGALRRGSPLRDKLLNVQQDLRDNPHGTNHDLTVSDIDNLRQTMRGRQATYNNPDNPSHNPHSANEIGDLMDRVTQIGGPAYEHAIQGFRNDSDYIAGFKHGASGKPVGDVNTLTGASLRSQNGQEGYEHGRSAYAAARNAKMIAPSTINEDPEFGAHHAAQLAAAVGTAPSMWSASHLIRALPGVRIPDKVQGIVAKQLFSKDPAVVQQGIANLRRGQAKDTDIRRMGAAIGGTVGANIARLLNPPGQPR